MRTSPLRPFTRGAALLALIASPVACSGSPKTFFHTLGVEQKEAASPGTPIRFKSVGIGPVRLPALLANPGVVLRQDDYTVELSSTHEWGGKLEDELVRAMTRLLRLRLPRVRVSPVPWEVAQAPEVQLVLALDRFDGAPGGEAVLRGTWTLQDPADGRRVATHRVELRQKVEGNDVRDLVRAQARLVARLTEQVVRGLR